MKLQLMKLRKAAGYRSRDDFAEKLGVNRHTYRSWETGAAQMNAEQLFNVAVLLDCSIDEILGHEVPTSFSDPREAELHRIWRGLDVERQNRLLANAHDMEHAVEWGGTQDALDAADSLSTGVA